MITLHVPDMHCNHCVERITKALKDNGITGSVALDSKTVSVEERDVRQAVELLDDLGFDAVQP